MEKKTWFQIHETKCVYPSLYEIQTDKIEAVEECLELLIDEKFPELLEMKIFDSSGKLIENPDFKPFLLAEIVGPLVYQHINISGLQFDEVTCDKLIDELFDYVFSRERTFICVVPLINFTLESHNELSLREFKIRKLEKWELEKLLELGYPLGSFHTPLGGSLEIQYCLEFRSKAPRRSFPSRPDVEEVISALRLFKKGDLHYNSILTYPEKWRLSYRSSGTLMAPRPTAFPYTLNEKEGFLFKSFWSSFRDSKKAMGFSFRTSLRWFNKSYEEREPVDEFLALAIGFETLFKTDKKLDIYVPHLVSPRALGDRLKIAEKMKILRDIRNSIVHAGFSRELTNEFTKETKEILRACLRKFVEKFSESRMTRDEILRDLEYCALR
jgi:hypothetical protein